MRYLLTPFVLLLMPCLLQAQVGIGIQTPNQLLHLHGGTALNSTVLFTNNSSGILPEEGLRVGLLHAGSEPGQSNGFVNLPPTADFFLQHGSFVRMHMNAGGQFGFNTLALPEYTATLRGPLLVRPTITQGARVVLEDLGQSSTLPVGLTLRKANNDGLHVGAVEFPGDQTAAQMRFTFRSGTAQERSAEMYFSDQGRVGIASTRNGQGIFMQHPLHVFGSQAIEGNTGQQTFLHLYGTSSSPLNYTKGAGVYYTYNSIGLGSPSALAGFRYFTRLNDNDLADNDARGTFTIGSHLFTSLSGIFNESAGITCNAQGQVGIGGYPDKSLDANAMRLDVIGNARLRNNLTVAGTSQFNGLTRVNANLVVQNTGSIGVRVLTPTTKLHVQGGNWDLSATDGDLLIGGGTSLAKLKLSMATDGGGAGIARINSAGSFANQSLRLGVNNNDHILLNADGHLLPFNNGSQNLGSSTARFNTLFATNGTINTSDARLKDNIRELPYGLREVLAMHPVAFEWKGDENRQTKLGLLAQDLQKLIPQVVAGDERESLGVYYADLIPVLIRALQEQQLEINELRQAVQRSTTRE